MRDRNNRPRMELPSKMPYVPVPHIKQGDIELDIPDDVLQKAYEADPALQRLEVKEAEANERVKALKDERKQQIAAIQEKIAGERKIIRQHEERIRKYEVQKGTIRAKRVLQDPAISQIIQARRNRKASIKKRILEEMRHQIGVSIRKKLKLRK